MAGQVHAAKIDDAAEASAEGRDDDALKLLAEILADPASPASLRASALTSRGELYASSRQTAKADDDFTAALALASDPALKATIYVDRAEVLARLGKTADAIEDYKQSLALAPGQIGGHTQLGSLYQRMGNREAALAEFDAELKIRPNYYRALVGRDVILGLPLPPDPEAGRK
jgi:tetratricopeptide (TPR) repeat protein